MINRILKKKKQKQREEIVSFGDGESSKNPRPNSREDF